MTNYLFVYYSNYIYENSIRVQYIYYVFYEDFKCVKIHTTADKLRSFKIVSWMGNDNILYQS